MKQHQTQQHFQMIQQTVMKVCLLFVLSFVVCVVIITNPLVVLLTLVLLPLINSLVSASTLVLLSGVLAVVHYKKNYVMTLLEKLVRQLIQRM